MMVPAFEGVETKGLSQVDEEALIAWQDSRSGVDDIYAQRVTGAGAFATGWGNVPVCTAVGSQDLPSIALARDVSGGSSGPWRWLRSCS